jgi:hypothetical protein
MPVANKRKSEVKMTNEGAFVGKKKHSRAALPFASTQLNVMSCVVTCD